MCAGGLGFGQWSGRRDGRLCFGGLCDGFRTRDMGVIRECAVGLTWVDEGF